MDKEQEEIQFLGFFGIFQESINITLSWRKIFTQITLAIIFPLSLIFLAHIEVSEFLFADILHNEERLEDTQKNSSNYVKISSLLSSEWMTFWLFKIVYFIFFIILSLLSTSAVVYTIACIYTAKEITFRKVMSVVPKVWKRLMVTFMWSFFIAFAYNVATLLIILIWLISIGPTVFGIVIMSVLIVVYITGFVYINIIWHLASVISVLEEDYGIQAMIKSKALIKGKLGIGAAIFLLLNVCFIAIQVIFQRDVVLGDTIGKKLGFGILSFFWLSILTLFGLIIQTVFYFVCKSYHHENIDKSCLSDHLEVYLGDYVPLKSKDVQLEQFHV